MALGDRKEAQRVATENFDRSIENREWERQNALTDWNTTNAYNSPEQQMERLRQAGLNPNLVYGKGADNTAQAISQTKTLIPQSKAHEMHAGNQIMQAAQTVGNGLSGYFQTRNVQAQTDNLYEQNALLKKEGLVKDLDIISKGTSNATSAFDLAQKQALKDNVIKRAQLENTNLEKDIEKKTADTQFTLDENQRKALSNTQDIKLTIQKILSEKLEQAKTTQETEQLKVMISNAKQEGVIKKLDAQLAEQGIRPVDGIYSRLILQGLAKLNSEDTPEGIKRTYRGQIDDVNSKGLGGTKR